MSELRIAELVPKTTVAARVGHDVVIVQGSNCRAARERGIRTIGSLHIVWIELVDERRFSRTISLSRLMDEHRTGRRQRVLKSGKIIYANGSIVIDCTIRNLSETGAQLKVPTSVGIPDRFEFSETMGGKRRPVTVMWRKVDLIGIRFD